MATAINKKEGKSYSRRNGIQINSISFINGIINNDKKLNTISETKVEKGKKKTQYLMNMEEIKDEKVFKEHRTISYVVVEFFPSRQELFDVIKKYLENNFLPNHFNCYNKANSLEIHFESQVNFPNNL